MNGSAAQMAFVRLSLKKPCNQVTSNVRRADAMDVSRWGASNARAFTDRHEAGRALADRLETFARRDDVVVLALPRGGVPIGY